MKSFGKRMFPMFAMAAIAIVIASGVSVAQLENDSSAPRAAAYDVDSCAPVHHAPVGGADSECATTWQMLFGSKN